MKFYKEVIEPYYEEKSESKWVKIYYGDCREILSHIEDNSVDLEVTSPPYSVGKDYETGVNFEENLELVDKTIELLARKLKPGKVLCWNISSNPQKNTLLYHGMILEKHLTFLDNIVWRKITGASPRFGNYVLNKKYYPNTVWEMIFVYSKGDPDITGSMEVEEAKKFRDDVWELRSDTSFTDHPAPFPIDLPKAAIELYTLPGDVVLDPFLGSGTTCMAAKELGRKSIGIEKDTVYCEMSANRIHSVFGGANPEVYLKGEPMKKLGVLF